LWARAHPLPPSERGGGDANLPRRLLLRPEGGAVASQHLTDNVRLRQRLYLKNRITCRHEPQVRLRPIRFAVEELAVVNFICGEAVRCIRTTAPACCNRPRRDQSN
jgi:hypothetical protein